MNVFFEHPLVAGAVAVAGTVTVLALSRLRRPSPSLPMRILLVLTAAAAAGAPSAVLPGAYPKLVYLVDVSPSMAAYLPALGRLISGEISELPSTVEADVLVFSAETRTAATGLKGGVKPELRLEAEEGWGFDPAGALKTAWFRIPKGVPGCVLLFTDGEFDRSELPSPPKGIETIVRSLPSVAVEDSAVSGIALPSRIIAGESVTARVTVTSNSATRATLDLLCGERLLASTTLYLSQGAIERAVSIRFPSPGMKTLTARITTEMPDSFPGNDYLERTVLVGGEPEIGVLCRNPAELRAWLRLLGPRGTAVSGRPDFSDYSGLLICGYPAVELPPGLERFVRFGGGVLLAGGEDAFDEGYGEGEVARISPVEPDPTGGKKVLVLLLIDKSGSLDRPAPGTGLTCFQILKTAVIAAMELAGRRTELACVAFDSEPHVLFGPREMRTPGERLEAQRRVAALRASGGTDLSSALKKAAEILYSSTADSKHLVIFHDGGTAEGDYLKTARELAARGIRIHLVAAGRLKRDVLDEIAKASNAGLTIFREEDWQDFPRRFPRLIGELKGERIKRGSFSASLGPDAERVLGLSGGGLPAVEALASLKVKEDAFLFAVCGEASLPLSAGRRYGAGRCSVFASSLSPGWAGKWSEGNGARFLSALVDWTYDTGRFERASLSIEERGGKAVLEASVRDEDGAPALNRKVSAVLYLPEAEKRVKLASCAAGKYRAALDDFPRSGSVTAVLYVDGDEAGVFPLSVTGGGEWAAGAFEPRSLASLAETLGGRYLDGPFRPGRDLPGRRSLLAWLGLLFCALLVLERVASLPAVTRALRRLMRGSHGRP